MRLGPVVAVVVLTMVAVVVPSGPGRGFDGEVGFGARVGAQDDLGAAEAAVAEATARLDELLTRLETTQRRGNDLAAEFWWVESVAKRLDRQVADTEHDRDRLRSERDALMTDVKEVAIDRYVTSGVPLGWGDTESISERAAADALAELFIGDGQDVLDGLMVLEAELATVAATLADQRARHEVTLDEVARGREQILADLEELTRLQGAIEGELEALETGLGELERAEAERVEAEQLAAAEAARIEAVRRRAEEAAARVATPRAPTPVPAPTTLPAPTATSIPTAASATPTPASPTPSVPLAASATPTPTAVPVRPAVATSGIVCPLAGAFTHTDDFTSPRAVGGIHRANDLIAAEGTPVLAVVSGTLKHKESSVGGLSAHLQGDDGNYYFFTHLHGYESVDAGHVPAGTVIGYVGMTGNAPIPHLHFEIHMGGRGNYVNPYPQVRAACGT